MLFYSSKSLVFTKILNRTTVFNIENFLSRKSAY